MKKKLSQKERGEVVTKGFLHEYLEEVLESKNYVTKEYLNDIFETYQKDTQNRLDILDMKNDSFIQGLIEESQRQIQAMIEENRHYFNAVIEVLSGRFERNEDKLENLDKRVTRLEVKPSF